MNISPRDILDKDFTRKMRGYDPGEVDEFLDEIIKQFESLIEENENVVAKNAELKSEVSRLRARDVKAENTEDKLVGVVTDAQRNANRYLERAEAQATKIMDMANANAKAMLESAHIRLENVQAELSRYERVITDYKRQFRRLVEQQAAYMDTHTINVDELVATRREVDGAVARIEQQMRELDEGPRQVVRRPVRELRSMQDANEELGALEEGQPEEADYGPDENSADLQEMVNDILDD